MRKPAILTVALLAACGGNYSNQDLEFVSALPVRSELQSKLPQQGSTQSALEGTQQQGLAVGDPSELYPWARGASDGFNEGLFFMLSIIDQIRLVPPSHRELDKRIWGPFPDNDRPGFTIEVVMERSQLLSFDYRIEVRRSDAPASNPWVVLVQGAFKATGGARKGSGEIHLLALASRNAGVPADPKLADLDTLDVTYVTDRSPVQVNMLFKGAPGASFNTVEYGYQESDAGQGSIQFTFFPVPLPPLPPATARITAQWLPSGAGRGEFTILDGMLQGAQQVECWNQQFRVTYSNKPWASPAVGDSASCAL